jgi:hypothetical protein
MDGVNIHRHSHDRQAGIDKNDRPSGPEPIPYVGSGEHPLSKHQHQMW